MPRFLVRSREPGDRLPNRSLSVGLSSERRGIAQSQLGVPTMWVRDPWTRATYFWVVICRNTKVHKSENAMIGHKIALAKTDVFESLPVRVVLLVKCDGCGEECIFKPSELLRLEMERPEHFTPHPRFAERERAGL